jgi:hypothetical protein
MQGLTKPSFFVPSPEYCPSSSLCAREQFAANDPDVLLQAAKLVEKHCDAVDINLCVLPFTPLVLSKAGGWEEEQKADLGSVVRLRWWWWWWLQWLSAGYREKGELWEFLAGWLGYDLQDEWVRPPSCIALSLKTDMITEIRSLFASA